MKRIITAAIIWLAAIGAAFAQETGWAYRNITADATTVLKTGPGYLHTVCVNTPAATATITVYDNTAASGTKISTITSFASVSGCFTYDVGVLDWTDDRNSDGRAGHYRDVSIASRLKFIGDKSFTFRSSAPFPLRSR